MARKYASVQDRIIANSVLSTESFFEGTPCWIWIGVVDERGYPRMSMRKPGKRTPTPMRAHRVSCEAFNGPIPDGHVVQHRCNVQTCVAPLHLKAGTQSENMHQCVADGRHNSQQFREEELTA